MQTIGNVIDAWGALSIGNNLRDSIGREYRIDQNRLQQLIGGKTWQPVTEIGTGPWLRVENNEPAPIEEEEIQKGTLLSQVSDIQGYRWIEFVYPAWLARKPVESHLRDGETWSFHMAEETAKALSVGAQVWGYKK